MSKNDEYIVIGMGIATGIIGFVLIVIGIIGKINNNTRFMNIGEAGLYIFGTLILMALIYAMIKG